MFAGCRNSDLQQCRQDNLQLQTKVVNLESQIVEEQDVSMRMLSDFLEEGNKTVKELDALKIQMASKDQQLAALQKQVAELNAKQKDHQKAIETLGEQLKKEQAEKQAALNQLKSEQEKSMMKSSSVSPAGGTTPAPATGSGSSAAPAEGGAVAATTLSESAGKAALEAGEAWIKLVDEGQYEKSWDEASTFLQKALPKEQLIQSLSAARNPLGTVKERKIIGSTFTTQAPGFPEGKYLVIQYQSAFENAASAVETVTPMLDTDGKWRVSGYFIK